MRPQKEPELVLMIKDGTARCVANDANVDYLVLYLDVLDDYSEEAMDALASLVESGKYNEANEYLTELEDDDEG